MTLLETLRAALQVRIDQRVAARTALDTILATPQAEARDLNETETTAFNEARDQIVAHDAEITTLEGRIAELEAIAARDAHTAELAETFQRPGEGRETVTVGTEVRTYRPDDAQRGVSFLQDLFHARFDGDPGAQQRLAAHMSEERAVRGTELRAAGTGAFAGLTVPQYLTDMVAPLARAMRPFADICNTHPLPADGMTVNISRITTGTSAAAQATENSAVSETDIDDTLLTINVRTIAGSQTLSRQAVDRSTGAEDIMLSDLVRAYQTALDSGIINGAGTSGTHLGVRSTSGIKAVTYTDASPTVAEAYPNLFDLVQQIQTAVFMGVSHFIMHPRRFWWFANAVGTNFPFLVVDNGAGGERAGSVNGTGYGGIAGTIAGITTIVDANLPTNLGAGTNEDIILGITDAEAHLWEQGAGAPLYIRAEQTNAKSLGVDYVVYAYSAFTAGRYPGAHGTIGGTGLVTPTFTGA